jgi:hypothetical protein
MPTYEMKRFTKYPVIWSGRWEMVVSLYVCPAELGIPFSQLPVEMFVFFGSGDTLNVEVQGQFIK